MATQSETFKYLDYVMREKIGIKGKSFITLIRKWSRKYGLKYTYWVINKALEIKNTAGKDITVGYLIGMLNKMRNEYNGSEVNMVIPTRESLLRAGYRIQDLPRYMLTKAEQSFFDGIKRDAFDGVGDEDVANVKRLFEVG